MKGLHRYEQHLGIEVSTSKPVSNFNLLKEPSEVNHYQIDHRLHYNTTGSRKDPDVQAKRQMNNKSKKRVQFAEESLESSVYDTNQVSEDEDDPLDHHQDQLDFEHDDDQH